MRPKILGTGLTGLIGSRIVEVLGEEFEFVNLGYEDGFDITRLETVKKVVSDSEAEILIHLAALTDLGAAWKERGDKEGPYYQVNTLGARNVASLCAKYQKYLIHFSTDFIFDGEKDEPYVETDAPNPLDWYGQTKLWAEEAVVASGCKNCILRTAFPFRANHPKSKLQQLVEALKAGSLYPQFSDKFVTPTFIDDLGVAMRTVFLKKPEGIYHLTGSSFVSHYELAKKAARVFGLDEGLVKKGSLAEFKKANPDARPYPRSLRISNLKAKNELGIEMKNIDDALLIVREQSVE